MAHRINSCLAGWLMAAVAALALAGTSGHALAQVDDPAELDIVTAAQVEAPQEFLDKCRERLRDDAARALQSLAPQVYENAEKPRDGAARFRLIVQYQGRIITGNQPVIGRGKDPESGGDRITWSLRAGQDGTIAFRLVQWDGKAYKPLMTWSAPVSDGPQGRLVEVAAAAVQPGGNAMMPQVTPEEIQKKIMEAVVPQGTDRLLLNWLLGVDLLGAEAKDDGTNKPPAKAQFALRNRGPWPVEKATISAEWGNARLSWRMTAEAEFSPAVAPGKTGKAAAEGESLRVFAAPSNLPAVTAAQLGKAPADLGNLSKARGRAKSGKAATSR